MSSESINKRDRKPWAQMELNSDRSLSLLISY